MGALGRFLLWAAPALFGVLKGIGRYVGRIGKGTSSTIGKGGVLASIGAFLSKVWRWVVDKAWVAWLALSIKIATFLTFFRKIIGTAVIAGILTRILQFLIKFILKKPVFIVAFLMLNEFFPTILETWFRLVGDVLLRIAIPLIQQMYNQMKTISETAVKDYESQLASAFASLPDCIGAHLSFLNVQGCVGMLATALGLCIAYRLVSMAYGFYFGSRR